MELTRKHGDIREDGYRFKTYHKRSDGKVYEHWASPEAYFRAKVLEARNRARRRAAERDLPCELTVEYLLEIFPKDNRCPYFPEIEMVFDGDRWNSPSLDRIDPKLGYVVGNVEWVSDRANKLKQDGTSAELFRIAERLSELEKRTIRH